MTENEPYGVLFPETSPARPFATRTAVVATSLTLENHNLEAIGQSFTRLLAAHGGSFEGAADASTNVYLERAANV